MTVGHLTSGSVVAAKCGRNFQLMLAGSPHTTKCLARHLTQGASLWSDLPSTRAYLVFLTRSHVRRSVSR